MHGRKAGLTPGPVSRAPVAPNVRYLEVKHSPSGNRLAQFRAKQPPSTADRSFRSLRFPHSTLDSAGQGRARSPKDELIWIVRINRIEFKQSTREVRMGASILEHFSTLEDPRIERVKEHQLLDIVVLAICAVVCGAEGWEAIELFGRTKLEWLRR